MNSNIDYQWPSSFYSSFDKVITNAPKLQLKQIENFYSDKYGCQVSLLPSARAALAVILIYKGVGRNHIMMAPKWSSRCVWDIIGRFSNPSCERSANTDFILKVNKWGYLYHCSSHPRQNIIADSVDTFFIKRDTILTDADCEIISLPKLFPCSFGGLLLSHDEKLHYFVRHLREKADQSLAQRQWKLRSIDHNFDEWECHEWKNVLIPEDALSELSQCVIDFNRVQSMLLKRLNNLCDKHSYLSVCFEQGRLPCVLPIPIKSIHERHRTKFMQRNFNFSFNQDNGIFEPAGLLPLHVGITDELFENWCGLLHDKF